MSTLLSPFVAAMSSVPLLFEMQNQNVFDFWDGLCRYLGAMRAWPAPALERGRAAVILIVQDLPAALVDIKLNRPLDGRQQMLREWRDYCLKTQWHPSALSLSAPLPVTDGDTSNANTQQSNSWITEISMLVPFLCYIVSPYCLGMNC